MGKTASLSFSIRNVSNSNRSIVGANSDCTCTSVKDLPFRLDPFALRALNVTVRGIKPGPFDKGVSLFTDDPRARVIRLTITGQIVASASEVRR